jgi:hypothetical protein
MGYQPPRPPGVEVLPLTMRDRILIATELAAMVAFALFLAGGLMAWRLA